MALADLLSLARHPAPPPILGTPVTPIFNDVGVVEPDARATKAADIRTEGERWAEAWTRDVERLWPEWMLEAFRQGVTEHAPAADRWDRDRFLSPPAPVRLEHSPGVGA